MSSSDDYIKVPKTSDRGILSAFQQCTQQFGLRFESGVTLAGIPITSIPAISIDADSEEPWASILSADGGVVKTLALIKDGFRIQYFRGGRDFSSPLYDEIRFYSGQPFVEDHHRLAVAIHLSKALNAAELGRSMGGDAERQRSDALQLSTATRLQQLSEDIIRRTTTLQQRLEEDYFLKKMKLREDLDREKARLNEEIAEQRQTLQIEEQRLAERESQIDDRNNTHARREMRDRMLDDVRSRIQNFGVSRTTEAKRRPIAIAFATLMALLLVLLVYTAGEIRTYQSVLESTVESSSNHPVSSVGMYLGWARFTLLSAGIFFTGLYYIRWQNRWADQHSATEFQLQQFYIDVNRANWIIESGLEWQKETTSQMPELILSSVTRNLFHNGEEIPPVLRPADELASALLGSASKLKIKRGENEIEFDKPGKIPKEI